MKRILFAVAVFFSLIVGVANADIYCGNGYISTDDPFTTYTTQKVIKLCGQPTKTKQWSVARFLKTYNGFKKLTTNYTRLTYNRGSNTFIEYLTFRNNRLINIKDGNYGSP